MSEEPPSARCSSTLSCDPPGRGTCEVGDPGRRQAQEASQYQVAGVSIPTTLKPAPDPRTHPYTPVYRHTRIHPRPGPLLQWWLVVGHLGSTACKLLLQKGQRPQSYFDSLTGEWTRREGEQAGGSTQRAAGSKWKATSSKPGQRHAGCHHARQQKGDGYPGGPVPNGG